jgi:cell division protein FtsA
MQILALDIGTSKIKAIVAEMKGDGKMEIKGIVKTPVSGMRKGEVADVDDVVDSLKKSFEEIRQISKSALKNILVGVSGANIKTQNSKGIVAVSRADSEIYSEDIDRVVKASQAVNLGLNRMVLHTLTREFLVDGIGDISDPLGMTGNRLEVNSLIIDAFRPAVLNVMKSVEEAGGKIAGMFYSPLASAWSVLTKSQKELGVLGIDIGFGATGMCVYEEGRLEAAKVFPAGAGNITNDLAIGLRCPVETAETIKLSFGSAVSRGISGKEKINLGEINEEIDCNISRRYVSEIIESRLAEIFEFVNNELKFIGKSGQLPAGAVLAGGGAKMPEILELAKRELKIPVKIGIPDLSKFDFSDNESSLNLEDPEFSAAVGILLWEADRQAKESDWPAAQFNGGKFLKILKNFLP